MSSTSQEKTKQVPIYYAINSSYLAKMYMTHLMLP